MEHLASISCTLEEARLAAQAAVRTHTGLGSRLQGDIRPGSDLAGCWSRARMLCSISPVMEMLGAPGTAVAPASLWE